MILRTSLTSLRYFYNIFLHLHTAAQIEHCPTIRVHSMLLVLTVFLV